MEACFSRWKKIFYLHSIFIMMYRSSRPEVFYKKGALRNLAKFTGKHLCQRLFFNKVGRLRPTTLLKKSLWHRCFSCEFCEISKNTFFYRTPRVAASGCINRGLFCKVTSNERWLFCCFYNPHKNQIPKHLKKWKAHQYLFLKLLWFNTSGYNLYRI